MEGSVFNFANNSDQPQEIELYETSQQGDGSATQAVWNFKSFWGDGAKLPADEGIYNTASGLFWDQTELVSNGAIAVRLWTGTLAEPTTFIRAYIGPLVNNLTPAGLQNFLNTNVNFSDFGTWYVEGPFDGRSSRADVGAVDPNSGFNIRVIPTQAFIDANNILTSEFGARDGELNYGVQSMIGEGVGWRSVLIYPSSYQVAPSLVRNPNVSVTSFKDFGYNEFLWSTIQRTYDIKNFQIFSDNKSQLLEPFLFDRTLATGKVYQKVLTPTMDPYQQQNYIITPEDNGYILDGFTKIKYTMLPFANVRLILDYTFIDLSTPLLIQKVRKPKIRRREIYSN